MKLHQLLGSPRTLQAWLKSELIDASKGNQLKAVVWQYRSEQVVPAPASKNEQLTEQVTPQVTSQVMTKLGSSWDQVGAKLEYSQSHLVEDFIILQTRTYNQSN